MAIEFDFYENPDPSGNQKGKYHARTVIRRTVTTDEMAREIQKASSLTVSDVHAVIIALTGEVVYNLGESNRVHLEGLGYFEPTLKTTKDIEPGKTHAQNVWFKSVTFRPDKSLIKRLADILTVRSRRKSHSAVLTNREVDSKVSDFFKENRVLNTRTLQFVCGFTKYVASKHIKRLVEEGKIENISTRRNPVYVNKNI